MTNETDQPGSVTPITPAEDSPVSRAQEVFGRQMSPGQVREVRDAIPGSGLSDQRVEELVKIGTTPPETGPTNVPDAQRSLDKAPANQKPIGDTDITRTNNPFAQEVVAQAPEKFQEAVERQPDPSELPKPPSPAPGVDQAPMGVQTVGRPSTSTPEMQQDITTESAALQRENGERAAGDLFPDAMAMGQAPAGSEEPPRDQPTQ